MTARQAFTEELAQAEPLKYFKPLESFNDDDVYVWRTTGEFAGEVLHHFDCKSADALNAKAHGMRLPAGQTWAKGMAARHLALWTRV